MHQKIVLRKFQSSGGKYIYTLSNVNKVDDKNERTDKKWNKRPQTIKMRDL